jgi:hypothetical protein
MEATPSENPAMNLSFTQFLKILLGAMLGAAIVWAVSLLLPRGILGAYESVFHLQQFGLITGALLGAAVTIIGLVVQDSHRPETGGAHNFSMQNGIGSRFIGKSDLREDGSYLTTEWFCVLWLPLFPVCNYRVVKAAESNLIPFFVVSRQFVILDKQPVRLKDVVKGYLITIGLVSVIGLSILFLRRWG